MKKDHIYIIIGIIAAILLVIVINPDNRQRGDDVSETDTTTEEVVSTPTPTVSTGGVESSTEKSDGDENLLNPPVKELVPEIPTIANLIGVTFTLTSYNGEAISTEAGYTLTFGKSAIDVKFCNSLNGNYLLDGSLFKAKNLVGTKAFCSVPKNLMEIETAFVSILGFGAQLHQVGNTLVLSHSSGTVMTFAGF